MLSWASVPTSIKICVESVEGSLKVRAYLHPAEHRMNISLFPMKGVSSTELPQGQAEVGVEVTTASIRKASCLKHWNQAIWEGG